MGIFEKFHIQNRKDQFPRRIKELKQATPIAGEVKVPDFIEHVTEQLRNEIDIDPDVYVSGPEDDIMLATGRKRAAPQPTC